MMVKEFRLDINAWLTESSILSMDAQGFYIELVMHYLDRDCFVPNDEIILRRMMRLKNVRKLRTFMLELETVRMIEVRNNRLFLPRAFRLIHGWGGRKPWSADTQEAVLRKTGGLCSYCGIELIFFSGPAQFHIDHVVPVARGGSNLLDNLTPACRSCNIKKGTMSADEFMAKISKP